MKKLSQPESGSQGQTTASRNRYGQYNRQRATPTQPRTAAQLAVRSSLTAVSQAWRGLTDEQRLAWDGYAAAHPRTDTLGQTITLTGSQVFNAVNILNLQAGIAIQETVPDDTALDAVPVDLHDITAATLEIQAGATIPATDTLLVQTSPPLSAGRRFNGDLRTVKIQVGSAAPAQVILSAADLSAKWGTLAVGQKYFLRVSVIRGGNRSPFTDTAFVLT